MDAVVSSVVSSSWCVCVCVHACVCVCVCVHACVCVCVCVHACVCVIHVCWVCRDIKTAIVVCLVIVGHWHTPSFINCHGTQTDTRYQNKQTPDIKTNLSNKVIVEKIILEICLVIVGQACVIGTLLVSSIVMEHRPGICLSATGRAKLHTQTMCLA